MKKRKPQAVPARRAGGMVGRWLLSATLALPLAAPAQEPAFDAHVHLREGEASLAQYRKHAAEDGARLAGAAVMWFGGPNQARPGDPAGGYKAAQKYERMVNEYEQGLSKGDDDEPCPDSEEGKSQTSRQVAGAGKKVDFGVQAFGPQGIKVLAGIGLTTVSAAGLPGLIIGGVCLAIGIDAGFD